jgi:predicted nucleic acid-binding protein
VTVLLDTSVIVDHLRNDTRAVRLMTEVFATDDRVCAAVPTRTEILAGLRPREHVAIGELFAVLCWVDIDAAIADTAGLWAHRYRLSNVGIDTVDYLIAAAAQSIGARLLTLNVRHFPMFAGLEPAYR